MLLAAQVCLGNTGRALPGLFICRTTLGMAAMPVKSVNKPRAEQLWDVFGDKAWNTEGRTWKPDVAGEEEQGYWLQIERQCWGWEWKFPPKHESLQGHGFETELLLFACSNSEAIIGDKENCPIALAHLLYLLSVLNGYSLIFVCTIGHMLQWHGSSHYVPKSLIFLLIFLL